MSRYDAEKHGGSMRPRNRLPLIALAAISGPALAQEQYEFNDPPGISRMLGTADMDGLKKLGEDTSMTASAARAARFRAYGELDNAVKQAEMCIATPEPSEVALASGVLYLCQILLAGAKYQQGDFDGWAKALIQARATFNSHLAKHLGPPGQNGMGGDFEAFIGRPINAVLEEPAPAQPVKVALIEGRPLPTLKGQLTGKSKNDAVDLSLDFYVDTGTPDSILSEEAARALKLSVTPQLGYTFDKEGRTNAGLAAPLNLTIGGVSLKNVQFTVMRGVQLNIIGMDVLQRLGGIRFEADALTFFDTKSSEACDRPFFSSSTPTGSNRHGWLRLILDGSNQNIILDTASDQTLQLIGAAPLPGGQPEQRLTTLGGRTYDRHDMGKHTITYDGKPYAFHAFSTTSPSPILKETWVLGWGSINTFSYLIDISRGLGCLMPAREKATGR
jgi:hypothetical protein